MRQVDACRPIQAAGLQSRVSFTGPGTHRCLSVGFHRIKILLPVPAVHRGRLILHHPVFDVDRVVPSVSLGLERLDLTFVMSQADSRTACIPALLHPEHTDRISRPACRPTISELRIHSACHACDVDSRRSYWKTNAMCATELSGLLHTSSPLIL